MERLLKAATALAEKLRQVHKDPKYVSVWVISQNHAGPYTGPQYVQELEELEKVLESELLNLQEAENLISELVHECKIHDSEYHHRTSPEVLERADKWIKEHEKKS